MTRLFFLFLLLIVSLSRVYSQDSGALRQDDTVNAAEPPYVPRAQKRPVASPKPPVDSLSRLSSTSTATLNQDSLSNTSTDSTVNRSIGDSVQNTVTAQPLKKPFDEFYRKLLDNPFFKPSGTPVYLVINERKRLEKDEIFYLLAGLLVLLAFIKLVFSRYFRNVFRLFFQPTFRQKQTREQLLQNNLPSLLLNFFFIISGAVYLTFLYNTRYEIHGNLWLFLGNCMAGLLILYFGKYLLLSFAGWVFNVKEAVRTYIFAVYLINKIMGVVLLPLTIVIALSSPAIVEIAVTLSLLLIILLLIYRYIVSYNPVRREVKITPLHFFLYVASFEILPLLLIYKTLIIYLNKSL